MSYITYQGKRVNFAGKPIKTSSLHTDLVGYWKLDEADGSVYDSYGNLHGSIRNSGTGVIQNQTGKINNAYQFNRDSSGAVYLPMGQFYAYQSDFTFTAWVYWYLDPDISVSIDLGIIGGETGSGSFVINKGTTYNYLRLESVALDLTGPGAGFCPSASEWAFVAVTCKYIDETHTQQVFYVNDTSVGTSKTWGYPFRVDRSSYTIGVKRPDQNQHFFNGYIDEVGIWQRVLSNDEILSLYNGSSGRTFPFVQNRQNLLSNIVSYWKLDETTGLPSDSVYSHDVITNTGVTLGQSGKINKSAQFELANNDVLVLGTHDDLRLLNKSFSYSAWIYPTSIPASGQFRGILGGIESTQWCVHSFEGESLRLRLLGENYIEYSTLPMYTNQWYHIVTVYNKDISTNNVTYYVNGVADYLTTDTSFSNGNIKWIGARSDGWENVYTFDGYIDEVGVWNRALTPTDVSLLYNSGYGRTYPFTDDYTNDPGLIRNGTFDDGSVYWSYGSYINVINGAAFYSGSVLTTLVQTVDNMRSPIKNNTWYTMSFDISVNTGICQFTVRPIDGTNWYIPTSTYTTGHHDVDFLSNSYNWSNGIRIQVNQTGAATWSIDNIRLREKY